MTASNTVNELFDTLAKVLLRCFVLGYALLLLWVVLYLLAADAMYVPVGRLFGLTSHEVDVVNYCGIAAVKCAVLLFFLFPYVAIRLVLRKRT